MSRVPPAECANCGCAIPRQAKACPECGADENTGWRENDATRYDGLNLPDSAFEDETDPRRRSTPSRRVNGLAWYWWCLAVVLLILLVLAAVR